MTSTGSFARSDTHGGIVLCVVRSVDAAGTRIADSVRRAQELRDAPTTGQRRQLVERHFAGRRAA